ncbi:hypothetical protein D6D13_10202 [Aureobasidium pullulans]|uniref:Uncharacterized protein n=1 Tax=Aureobasidium pullulans TaxID=5580 RepID=A0A4V4IY64_AURPU|nr:hypothetical protein D6D13_10202 [Aureobasidium pullulans]
MNSLTNDPSIFDGVHEILACHNHPFILVGPRAVRWMGINAPLDPACDIVLRKNQFIRIVTHLANHKDWKITDMRHEDPNLGYSFRHDPIFAEADALLERKCWTDDGVNARYLRIWSDETLHLNIRSRSQLVRVPDSHTRKPVLVEMDYHPCRHRDDDVWFGPDTMNMAMESSPLTFNLPRRGLPYRNYRVYIPTIPAYWDALVAQKEQDDKRGLRKSASRQMNLLFRYLLRDLWNAMKEAESDQEVSGEESAKAAV